MSDMFRDGSTESPTKTNIRKKEPNLDLLSDDSDYFRTPGSTFIYE